MLSQILRLNYHFVEALITRVISREAAPTCVSTHMHSSHSAWDCVLTHTASAGSHVTSMLTVLPVATTSPCLLTAKRATPSTQM